MAVGRGARARDAAHQGRLVARGRQDHLGGDEGDACGLAAVRALCRVHLELGVVLEQLALRTDDRRGTGIQGPGRAAVYRAAVCCWVRRDRRGLVGCG